MPRSRTTRRARAGSKCFSLRACSARFVSLTDSTPASPARRRRSGREKVPGALPRLSVVCASRPAHRFPPHPRLAPRHDEVPPAYSTERRRSTAGSNLSRARDVRGAGRGSARRSRTDGGVSRTHPPALAPHPPPSRPPLLHPPHPRRARLTPPLSPPTRPFSSTTTVPSRAAPPPPRAHDGDGARSWCLRRHQDGRSAPSFLSPSFGKKRVVSRVGCAGERSLAESKPDRTGNVTHQSRLTITSSRPRSQPPILPKTNSPRSPAQARHKGPSARDVSMANAGMRRGERTAYSGYGGEEDAAGEGKQEAVGPAIAIEQRLWLICEKKREHGDEGSGKKDEWRESVKEGREMRGGRCGSVEYKGRVRNDGGGGRGGRREGEEGDEDMGAREGGWDEGRDREAHT
ncbi:hypothetical protein C8R44DRAFT_753239 [Mycena epipterygia]|nr:hypothetical protein C8R44DRAFT_753239 [Mycena epipterygia]